jgi:hypothetical protein
MTKTVHVTYNNDFEAQMAYCELTRSGLVDRDAMGVNIDGTLSRLMVGMTLGLMIGIIFGIFFGIADTGGVAFFEMFRSMLIGRDFMVQNNMSFFYATITSWALSIGIITTLISGFTLFFSLIHDYREGHAISLDIPTKQNKLSKVNEILKSYHPSSLAAY